MKKIYFVGFLVVLLLSSPSAAQASAKSSVTPEAALKMLQEGNKRFVACQLKRPNQDTKRCQETATKGQSPFAAVLSCADSRVPVEVLFDRGIGDIFVVRDAGNIATVTDIGSMEYAVEHLGTPLVVVLGHSHCGAVTAAVKGGDAPPNIKAIMDYIAPAVAAAKAANPDKSGEGLVNPAIAANVLQAMADIFQKSPLFREKVKSGGVRVEAAIYDLKSRQVTWLGPHPQQAQLVAAEAK